MKGEIWVQSPALLLPSDGDIHEYTIGPAASWELDVAGGIRRNAAAARDEVQAAEAYRSGTRIVVAADAADAYLQVRGYQARIVIAKIQMKRTNIC